MSSLSSIALALALSSSWYSPLSPMLTLKLPFNLKIHLALEEVARGVVDLGAGYTITSRRVADDLLLHRVEIDGLKNSEEANHIWLAGLGTNGLDSLTISPEPGKQVKVGKRR